MKFSISNLLKGILNPKNLKKYSTVSPFVEFKSFGNIFLDFSVNLENIANNINVI